MKKISGMFISIFLWSFIFVGISFGGVDEGGFLLRGPASPGGEERIDSTKDKDFDWGKSEETTRALRPFIHNAFDEMNAEAGYNLNPGSSDLNHGASTLLAKVEGEQEIDAEITVESISDPLEPINRIFYHFNDKLYFWLLKPAATGYKAIVPKPVRVSVSNFFYNLAFPIRFINCLFQGKLSSAGDELARFSFNTIIGIGGLFDFATKELNLKRYEEDLGQTLGSYGIGTGFYINWPVLGPSSVRDTIGLAGDSFLDPVNYIVPRTKYNISVKAYNSINKTSLSIGDYEDLKESALDPYIAVRNAYYQYRKDKIKE